MADNPENKKSRASRVLELDGNMINKSQLNNSSSKMQYSIGKASRFEKEPKNHYDTKFYDIPDTKAKRSTSFGYGNKMELGKSNFKVPSPSEYSFKSEFETKKGITISAGREVIKNNSAFETPKNIPGPGQYNPKTHSLGEDKNQGPILRSREPDNSDKWQKCVPGPGSYATLELLDKNMRSKNSRIQNVRSAKFSKSQRTSDIDRKISLKIPGPGNYDKEANVNVTAKFPLQGGYRFSHCARQGIEDKSKKSNPGPGAYQSFSEFLH